MNRKSIIITLGIIVFFLGNACQTVSTAVNILRETQPDQFEPDNVPQASTSAEPAVPAADSDIPESEDFDYKAELPTLSGPTVFHDSEHFRIHYTLEGKDQVPDTDEDKNGSPDWVELVSEAAEIAYAIEVVQFGWAAPLTDGEYGGNSLYDIYLYDTLGDDEEGAGMTSGWALADETSPAMGDNPSTPIIREHYATCGHIVIDNDFIDPEYSSHDWERIAEMRSTVVHEFNHLIQFGYDVFEPDEWIWEATATWMEYAARAYYPLAWEHEINGSPLPGELISTLSPSTCQLEVWYDNFTILLVLENQYSPDSVRLLWERFVQADGYTAMEIALSELGTDMNELMRDYGRALLLHNIAADIDPPALEAAIETGSFQPTYGVGQMGLDFLRINPRGTLSAVIVEPDFEFEWVAIRNDKATVFSSDSTINTDDFDHVYLIVHNTQRADTITSCSAQTYTLQLSLVEDDPAIPLASLPADQFKEPVIGEKTLSEFYGEGEYADAYVDDIDADIWINAPNWYAITAHHAGIPKDQIETYTSLAAAAEDHHVDLNILAKDISAQEEIYFAQMLDEGKISQEQYDQVLLHIEEIIQYLHEPFDSETE